MTPPIYDDKDFFDAYSQLPRSQGGLSAMPEWPALHAMLPDLNSRRVLDLGCGFGWFCRWAREQGAVRVLGVDVSERMLERAHDTTSDPAIAYIKADLETLNLPQATFDVAYSALAFHYVEHLERLFGEIHRALNAGGAFIFSVAHPMNKQTGIKYQRTLETYFNLLGTTGFTLDAVEEWSPTQMQIQASPEFEDEFAPEFSAVRERPTFLLISARR